MGNMRNESGFNPFEHYNKSWSGTWNDLINSSGAIGLVQWTNYNHDPSNPAKLGRKYRMLTALPEEFRTLYENINQYQGSLVDENNYKNLIDSIGEDTYDKLIATQIKYIKDEQEKSYGDAFGSSNDVKTMAMDFCYSYEGGGRQCESSIVDGKRRDKWAEFYYNEFKNKDFSSGSSTSTTSSSTTTTTNTLTGTGDFDAIMKAKNANKQATDFDDPTIRLFEDDNPESMKTFLENYGDLAYQLGRAVGAPWVAILVQMRYEDPHSVCGKNNFWGNGCPPGTKAGGASIQGKNLGEGFQQYGKTLTNGNYDNALGIADPKRYLEVIGHNWVKGPNSTEPGGYAQIEGMKNSVDALQKFIDSEEGQAIVNTFGSYSGYVNCPTGSSSATHIGEAASVGKSAAERLKWLFPDGVPTTQAEMQQYLTTVEVPIINESG